MARAAVAMANALAETENVQVTLRPIFFMEKNVSEFVSNKVIVKPLFGFYFHGLSKVLSLIPDRILHNLIFESNKYDIEIGFQHGTATRAVTSDRNKNKRHLVWIHGYDDKLEMKKYYIKADTVVCVSKSNAKRLSKDIKELKKRQIDYCYNPIDDFIVESMGNEKSDLNESKNIRFITVGRLSPEKGYMRLLKVLLKLKNEGYLFQMIFVGDGPQRSELETFVKQHSMEEFVSFKGTQSNPHKFTSKCDIFICSSYSEGYSTSSTEAIMLGIPVISTLVSGAEEIIGDADCGLVVDNNDKSLYLGLKKVLDDPTLIPRWKSILKRTKYNFSKETRIGRLKKILEI
ncbi:glycosyltransferase [Clostridium perfringens]|uniref:glycosyltransferase n=1 Tax=Clostridium perfringens TaxID=1502 RepID=UPI0018E48B48|nr:glycosyltransferase [Clostridium perfringens]MDK0843670.1 glycosyltransferase [Clostridium perfringens]HAT4217981.1 glycosyltransferase [Clostridium perfringens]